MKSQAVVKKSPDQVPEHLRTYESRGVGIPTKADDFLLPMAKVLGPQSPEVLKGNANYVSGAEAGDILIKNLPRPLIKAREGLIFQPCYIDEAAVEWLARGKGGGGGGGFVARHPVSIIGSSDSERVDDWTWVRRSTGNQLVHTRYVSGYMIDHVPLPLVLSFSSTGHTVAKNWYMTMLNQRLGDQKVDIWLVYYRVSTRLRQRGDQSWYILDIANAGPDGAALFVPTTEDSERGRQLHESLAHGERRYASEEVEWSGDAL